jgi:ribose/xylose/arabinose/galactoside ABC-type transport system permease subunit
METERNSLLNRDEFKMFMQKYGIGLILVALIILMIIISPTFRTLNNAISVLLQVSINGILALGMAIVITTGGIDLSIGSMLALASVTIGVVLPGTDNIFLAVFLAVLFPTLFGVINGLLIAVFEMVPFVVTLATQLVIRGIAYVASGGGNLVLTSEAFREIGGGKLFGIIPNPVVIFIVITILIYLLMHHTRFGRYVYATGGNLNAAIASGVNVFSTRVYTYTIMGFCAGAAGVIMASRINAGQPNIGAGYELDAIAACVIGGTSFLGGVSTVPGVVIGILFIGVIYNSMNLLQISSYYQTIAKGLLILIAILLDLYINKKRS